MPASELTGSQRNRLAPLLTAGVLREVRAGSGVRLVVSNVEALRRFIERSYPSGLKPADCDPGLPRAAAVAALRDSKRAKGPAGAVPVLVRGFGNSQLRRGEEVLDVAGTTAKFGVAAFVLWTGEPAWATSGTVAIVENREPFLKFEKLAVATELVVYAGGRLDEAVLKWLSSPEMEGCRFLHFGDYDPVGLDEYLRLCTGCPGRVSLYVPPDLESLVSAYGKRQLLEGQEALLSRLRTMNDPTVARVVAAMDRANAGLEQEILFTRR